MGSTASANTDLAAALEAAQNDYAGRNPTSRHLHQKACATLPGGNTRSVLYSAPFPISLVRGKGVRLWDADGHEYVDFLGEYSAGLFGHSHPAIRAAVEQAMDRGIDLGGLTEMEAELAAGICGRFPSIDLVRFTNSGTEANLLSLVAARSITGRSKFLAFRGGYHGGVLIFLDGGSPINVPLRLPARGIQRCGGCQDPDSAGSGGSRRGDPGAHAGYRGMHSRRAELSRGDTTVNPRSRHLPDL